MPGCSPEPSNTQKKSRVQTHCVSSSLTQRALPGILSLGHSSGNCGACRHFTDWNNKNKQTIKYSFTGRLLGQTEEIQGGNEEFESEE